MGESLNPYPSQHISPDINLRLAMNAMNAV
jgi:hypothetical protein